jgi:UDP-N-acetylglucosamine--N-acetylmuramyl-(pentapeptide) pyrophosphoryl-undecaprenol N-acetylglucosamine transferase
LYIGSKNGPESAIAQNQGWNYRSIAVGKLRRYWSWQNFIDPFKVFWGTTQAWRQIGKFKPDVLFSKGGFVSVPVTLAAWIRRVPIVIHDSDAIPGLTTKLLTRFAFVTCLGYEEAAKKLSKKVQTRLVATGTPVRATVLKGSAAKGRSWAGFKNDKPMVLIMGGSLGAQAINQAVEDGWGKLTVLVNVIHLTGRGKLPSVPSSDWPAGYKAVEYVTEELPDLYAAADLIVSRAGANSLAEICALGKPTILIPLGTAASHGDQIANTKLMVERGASVMLANDNLSAEILVETVKRLLDQPEALKRMGQAAQSGPKEKMTSAQKLAQILQNAAT